MKCNHKINPFVVIFSFLIPIILGIIMVPKMSAARELATSISKQPLTVALTFDDGPYATSTEAVLKILSEKNVHATFFLVGQNVAAHPEITKHIVASGNVIGNHTYTHLDLSSSTIKRALSEVSRTDLVIASTTGIHTKLFRPPYGILPAKIKRALVRRGYQIHMWNDDPRDWDNASSSADQIVARVEQQEKPNLVVLLHDGRDTHIQYPRDNMLRALPVLIDDLKADGFTFVTLESTSTYTVIHDFNKHRRPY